MKKHLATLCACLVLTPVAFAQHEHSHGGFMSEGAAHKLAKGTRLVVSDGHDEHGPFFTVRLGPLTLPARSGHAAVAQMPEYRWSVPITGWFTGYSPRLVDAGGARLPGKMLHHIALWNTARADFLCTNKEEHIFGAGGEMNQWPVLPGVGYAVEKGDAIRVDTMFHNPTAQDFPQVYLEFDVRYVAAGNARLRNVYPAWFDVQQCGRSGYDLAAGPSTHAGTVTVRHAGRLLGVGGHMHDFGQSLRLSRGADTLAELPARASAAGELQSMPIVDFMMTGGLPLGAGDPVTTTAAYDNRSGKLLPEGAMGIVVGYFLPDHAEEMSAYSRKPAPSAAK